MRQRVMLALALAGNPSLVIADEPTSALDASLSRDVMEPMLGLTATNGIALLLATHDIKLCEEYSYRTLVMYRGSVVEELDSSLLTTAAGHRYTQGLVRCVPTLEDADRESLETIGEWLDLGGQDGTDDVTDGRWPRPTHGPGAAMPDPGGYVQLVATDITKVFGRRRSQRHTAVYGVSLTVESGQAVGIVGESGSGKSTFARILAGIELPTAGTVYFNDVPIASQLRGRDERLNLRRHVRCGRGHVVLVRSAQNAAGLGPLPRRRLLGLSRAQADTETDRVMADLGLAQALADPATRTRSPAVSDSASRWRGD